MDRHDGQSPPDPRPDPRWHQGLCRGRDGSGQLGWTYQIQDIDPNGGFAFKTITRNALGMDGSVRLTPTAPDKTKVDYTVQIQTRGLLRILEPLLRGEMAGNEARELVRPQGTARGRPGGDRRVSPPA